MSILFCTFEVPSNDATAFTKNISIMKTTHQIISIAFLALAFACLISLFAVSSVNPANYYVAGLLAVIVASVFFIFSPNSK